MVLETKECVGNISLLCSWMLYIRPYKCTYPCKWSLHLGFIQSSCYTCGDKPTPIWKDIEKQGSFSLEIGKKEQVPTAARCFEIQTHS